MDATKAYLQTRKKIFEKYGIDPKSNFIETDGPVKKIHYLELGSGDPLLLIHGGLSHSGEWLKILKPLSEHYHVFALDRPGHGLSEPIDYRGVDYRKSTADFIRSVMDALGIKKANLMGNSMGGYFSLAFTLDFPDRVNKLVLIGAPAGMNRWIPPMLRLLGIPGLNRFLGKTVAKPSAKGARMIHQQLLVADIDKVIPEELEFTALNQALPGAALAHTTMLENVLDLGGWKKKWSINAELSRLTIPVQFIWGDHDAFEGPETGRVKAARIKNHRFDLIENAGHLPWLDQPEICVQKALEFLKS